MNDTTFNPAELKNFTGTENWYRHALVSYILFTDGAKYVADTAGAYWLLDEIALAQRFEKAMWGEDFQVWKLAVENSAATLTCANGYGMAIFRKPIAFTDFPGEGVTLWVCNSVIMVPSEY